jgi:acyl carrier protein
MKTQEEVFSTLRRIMSEMFELAPEDIVLDASLKQDLDIDSIDAVDLMVRLREITGKRINPEDFKNARTIQDVVDTIYRITAAQNPDVQG